MSKKVFSYDGVSCIILQQNGKLCQAIVNYKRNEKAELELFHGSSMGQTWVKGSLSHDLVHLLQ